MRRIIIYLTVTFGLTWGLLIPAGFLMGTFQDGENSAPAMMALIALSMFFPLAGALITNKVSPPEERIRLGWNPNLEGHLREYLFAWFAPAILVLSGGLIFFLANPNLFDPTMNWYLASAADSAGIPLEEVTRDMPPVSILMFLLLISSVFFAPFLNMFFAFGEESGWRGMLFPALNEEMSQRSAAVVSGVIWGIWHAPAIAMGHNYGMGYAGFPLTGILTMVLMCTAMGCWMAYLRMRTESIWLCSLAHGAFNAVTNLGLLFCIGGATVFGPSALGLVAGIPLLGLGIWSWLKLSDQRRGAIPDSAGFPG